MHAQFIVHRRTDERKYCCQYRSHDDGGCDGACAVDCVAVHEVLDKTGHDLGDTYAEWNPCKNWDYPMDRWKSRPDTQGEEIENQGSMGVRAYHANQKSPTGHRIAPSMGR